MKSKIKELLLNTLEMNDLGELWELFVLTWLKQIILLIEFLEPIKLIRAVVS